MAALKGTPLPPPAKGSPSLTPPQGTEDGNSPFLLPDWMLVLKTTHPLAGNGARLKCLLGRPVLRLFASQAPLTERTKVDFVGGPVYSTLSPYWVFPVPIWMSVGMGSSQA